MLLRYDGPRTNLAVGLPDGSIYHHERGTVYDYDEPIAITLLAEVRHRFVEIVPLFPKNPKEKDA